MRVAMRIVGSRDRAEDVVQDVCVRVLTEPSGFDGRCRYSTWLHRITVNRSIDVLRKHRRESGYMVDLDGDLDGLLDRQVICPKEAAQNKELRQIARLLIDELPDECRRSFMLTQLDGYTYDEAAEIEGIARGTVASRVSRARRILVKHISGVAE